MVLSKKQVHVLRHFNDIYKHFVYIRIITSGAKWPGNLILLKNPNLKKKWELRSKIGHTEKVARLISKSRVTYSNLKYRNIFN